MTKVELSNGADHHHPIRPSRDNSLSGWLMRLSRGRIKDRRTADLVLIIISIIFFTSSFIILFRAFN
ncbi:MAG: hypothetical protein WDZ85_00270 [Candidatus Paceibacterota bacterium]